MFPRTSFVLSSRGSAESRDPTNRMSGWRCFAALIVGLSACLSCQPARAQSASVTSPESGGEAYRLARIHGYAAASPSANKLKIDAPSGTTFTFRPVSGFQNASESTGSTATWDLDPMGDPVNTGVEFEVEAASAEEGANTFTLTFRQDLMMMIQDQTPVTADVDLNYSIGTPISRQTVLRQASGLPVNRPGGSFYTTETAYTPLGTQFALSYNSRVSYFPSPPSGMPSKPFGNWYASFYRYIKAMSGTPAYYTNVRGRGDIVHFVTSGNQYKPDVPENLSFDQTTHYKITLDQQQVEKYDSAGKLTALVDANSNTWSFSYGTVGSYSAALTKVTDPNSDTYVFTYDATPGLVTKVEYSATGTTWALTYDASDNLTKLAITNCAACGGDLTRAFTYSSGSGDPDLNGNLLTVKNADALQREAFVYNAADRATKITLGEEDYVYSYDDANRRLTKTDALSHNNIFHFDGKSLLTKTDRAGLSVTSYAFDTSDNLTKLSLPEGLVVEQLFDSEKHRTKQTNTKGAQSVSQTWRYDATVKKATKWTDLRGQAWVFKYSATGNLTKRTEPAVTLGVPSSRQAVTSLWFDGDGNLTKVQDPLGVEHRYSYSNKDLLTKQVGDATGIAATVILRYDATQRLTKHEDALSGATVYAYEGFRVTKVTTPKGVVNTWDFDTDGRLTRRVLGSGAAEALTTDFLYDKSDRATKETADPAGLALASEILFDAAGNLTRTKFPDGNFGPTLTYDAADRGTKSVWGNLKSELYLDDAGRVTKQTDTDTGNSRTATATFTFDGLGRLTRRDDPLSHYATLEYDAASNLTKELAYQSGGTLLGDMRSYFDEAGRPYQSDRMLDGSTAASTDLVRDIAGRVTKATDPESRSTLFKYDALGRLTRTTDAESKNWDGLFDATGRMTKLTNPLGAAGEVYFDADGLVTKRVDPAGSAVTFKFDALARLTRVTDPLANNTDSYFDVAGRLTKVLDPGGGQTTSLYDAASRRTKVTVKVTGAVSQSTTYAYSNLGRLTRATDPLSNNTDREYDAWGRLTKVLDAESNAGKFLFDAAGRLTKSIAQGASGDGPDVELEYDGLGRRTRVLNDAGTGVQRYMIDRLGRLTKLLDANDNAETYLYDLAGQRTKLTRPTTDQITFLYDQRGLLTKSTLPGSVDQVFSYDAAGQRTHAGDPNTDLDWILDAAGRVTKLNDNTLSKTIVYAYDAAGQRTKLDGPEASDTQHWRWDAAGRLTKITENSVDRASWLYNLAGQATKQTLGSGSTAVWQYDAAFRLTSLVHKKSGGTVIQSFGYLLDKTGNRTKLTLNGGDYLEFLSDRQYQLTKETRKNSGGTLLYSNSFWYDNRGNRTKLDYNDGSSTTTTTSLYSLADALTKSTTGGTDTTYQYDASGNQTRKSVGGTNYDFYFDVRNLLTKYTDGTTAEYAIDALGRRAKKTVGATVERYLYDSLNVLAEYDGSGTPALQASYLVASLDRYISQTRGGSVYYFHQDALGSVWNLTDSSEVVQNAYQYEAFGAIYGTVTQNVTNPYRFTGRRWDTESGTHHYRFRQQDQSIGRFLTRDLLGLQSGDPNFYRYALNAPLTFIDPLGLAGQDATGRHTDLGDVLDALIQNLPNPDNLDQFAHGVIDNLGKDFPHNWSTTLGWTNKQGILLKYGPTSEGLETLKAAQIQTPESLFKDLGGHLGDAILKQLTNSSLYETLDKYVDDNKFQAGLLTLAAIAAGYLAYDELDLGGLELLQGEHQLTLPGITHEFDHPLYGGKLSMELKPVIGVNIMQGTTDLYIMGGNLDLTWGKVKLQVEGTYNPPHDFYHFGITISGPWPFLPQFQPGQP